LFIYEKAYRPFFHFLNVLNFFIHKYNARPARRIPITADKTTTMILTGSSQNEVVVGVVSVVVVVVTAVVVTLAVLLVSFMIFIKKLIKAHYASDTNKYEFYNV
jgi:hypothetical protein